MPRRQWVICAAEDAGFQWTKERIISLIEQYSNWSELWDRSHPYYKDESIRYRVWKEVGRDMLVDVGVNPGVLETQYMMKNLASQFQKEWRKVKSGKVKEEEIKWAYYHHLKFLKDTFIPRKPKTSKTKIASEETKHNTPKTMSSKSDNASITQQISSQNHDMKEEKTMVVDEPIVTMTPSISKSPRKKRKYNQLEKSSVTMDDAPPELTPNSPQSKGETDTMEESTPISTSDLPEPKRKNNLMEESSTTEADFSTRPGHTKDEFGVFGEHVAWQIRTFSDKKEQTLAIHKINTLLFEIKMSQEQ